MSFSLSRTARSHPALPYADIKNAVLGRPYELSLVFVGTQRARALNQAYRGATYTPNVLSFPLSEQAGEIFITPQVAKREAKKAGMTFKGYVGFLFIHGLLHLKGYPHGDTMEKAEKRYMKRFHLK